MEINIKTKNRIINNTSPTYIIAEIGINHNGRYDLAEKLIIESAKAGVDAVKFQKRDAKSIMINKNINSNPKGYLSKNENDISIDQPEYGSWSYPDTRLELSEEDYIKLKDVAENLNVDFFASPWDQKSLEFLIKIGISIVKIPSVEITNYDYEPVIFSKMILHQKSANYYYDANISAIYNNNTIGMTSDSCDYNKEPYLCSSKNNHWVLKTLLKF